LNDIENVVSNNNFSTELPVYGDLPVDGILSLFFGLIGIALFITALALHSYIYMTLGAVFSTLAIIFGIKGSDKRLKGFAISGFVLGGIGVILLLACLIASAVDYNNKYYYYDGDLLADYTWHWRFNGYEGY
tara:strand:+ start:234 stop:629 length:396 start_codon:yes stop_codon:yes gene_type:complete